MELRKFNKRGNDIFIAEINKIIKKIKNIGYKKSFNANVVTTFNELIKNRNYTEELPNSEPIIYKKVLTRFELGKYLNDILKNCKINEIFGDENLWNWLSAFYIRDTLAEKGGLNSPRFIYFNDFHSQKLNLIRTAWLLYNINQENSKFVLSVPLHSHSNACEQYVSRPELYRNPIVSKLCMKYYFDEKNSKLKTNSAKHEKNKDGEHIPGVLYPRFYKKFLKISKLYDVWNIKLDDLDNLMSKEFDYWKQSDEINEEKNKKNPIWSRNEQIILLKYYFETDDPETLSKNNNVCQEISQTLKSLDEHKGQKNDNFRSSEGVRRKILNFVSIDPSVDDEGLEHYSRSDEKIFYEFYNNEEKLKELPLLFKIITNKKIKV